MSTTESEFIAACIAAQEMIWTLRLIKDLISNEIKTPTLYCDNQSAIQIIKDLRYHYKTKHIDTKYKFIRDYYNKNVFQIKYIESANQQADILTKALPIKSFEYLRSLLNVGGI